MNIVRSVMDALASVYDYADAVYVVLGVILSALTFHHTLYFIVSIFLRESLSGQRSITNMQWL